MYRRIHDRATHIISRLSFFGQFSYLSRKSEPRFLPRIREFFMFLLAGAHCTSLLCMPSYFATGNTAAPTVSTGGFSGRPGGVIVMYSNKREIVAPPLYC